MQQNLVVKFPSTSESYQLSVLDSTSVGYLKLILQNSLPNHPPSPQQKLVHGGRLLNDNEILREAFSTSQGPYVTIHCVVQEPSTTQNAPVAHNPQQVLQAAIQQQIALQQQQLAPEPAGEGWELGLGHVVKFLFAMLLFDGFESLWRFATLTITFVIIYM